MPNTHKKNAFSLVELAIVLVIIGLLAGGVLTGQSLIRNAELQSVVSEVNGHKDAVAQFQAKYNDLPGDMSDATDYWGDLEDDGSVTSCENGNAITDGDGNDTCDGDGNGVLDVDYPNANDAQEWFHAWVHLRNADLIDGTFTGLADGGTYRATPGLNVPRSTLDDGGYTMLGLEQTGQANWWNGDYNPAIILGRQTATVETGAPLLVPDEAWNIDTKMDDGRPALGKVRSFRVSTCNTASTAVANFNIAEYLLTSQTVGCALIFSLTDPGQ